MIKVTECQWEAQHREYYRKSYKTRNGRKTLPEFKINYRKSYKTRNGRKTLPEFKINYNISTISRYVDDILIIYNNNKYFEEQIAQELNALKSRSWMELSMQNVRTAIC